MPTDDTKPTIISLDQLQKEEEPKKGFTTPQLEGEASVSGNMPDPESDDDVLKNAHDMGLQRGETYDNAQSLDEARDVNSNEKYQHDH